MIWSTEGGPDGDTDAGLGARDGGGRARAGPAEFARQHDVPAALVAEGVGARSDHPPSQGPLHCGEAPRCPKGHVAKAFGVTLPAVTHIVDRLEQKAFLVRGDHPADRRIYVLDLTRAGKALVEELQAMRLRGMEGVLGRMSLNDRRRVVVGLEALVDAASSESDGTAKPARSRRAK